MLLLCYVWRLGEDEEDTWNGLLSSARRVYRIRETFWIYEFKLHRDIDDNSNESLHTMNFKDNQLNGKCEDVRFNHLSRHCTSCSELRQATMPNVKSLNSLLLAFLSFIELDKLATLALVELQIEEQQICEGV